jgi:putative oxidoreductase
VAVTRGASPREAREVFMSPQFFSPYLLGVLRIMTGLLFLQHPFAKFFKIPHVASFDNLQLFSLVGLAGTIELVGGTLLVLGLFTRPVAFILSGEMAVAYFMGHAPSGFFPLTNGGEPAVLFCFIFLYLAAAGGGAWSIDSLRRAKSNDEVTKIEAR